MRVRRSLAVVLAASLLLAGRVGLARADAAADEAKLYDLAKQDGKVVFYESATQDAMMSLASAFKRKYPGVEVEPLKFTGLEITQRMTQESEAHQYIADVVSTGDKQGMQDLIGKGDIAEWRVPTADRYSDFLHISDSAYSPYIGTIVVAYNPTKLSQEEIDLLANDWKGLLDPRFKGRFSATLQVGVAMRAPLFMFLDPKLSARYGMDFLNGVVAQKPVLYRDYATAVDRVIAGENDFTIMLTDNNPYPRWQAGAPIRWVSPSPTSVVPNSWVGIVNHAPHPNAARLFQDWMFSDDGQAAYQESFGSRAAMSGVPDTRKVAQESWYKPYREAYDVDLADQRWIGDYDKDTAMWVKLLNSSH